MNTQVRLQNSVRLAGGVNSELVGSMDNTERMIRELCVIQYTKSKHFLKIMSYLLFISGIRTRCFEHYTVCTRYATTPSACENRRIFRIM